MDFTIALKEWQLFFSTVALASVTLAGLLFVSLSLRFERIRMESFAGTMNLARQSFSDFLYVLMLGLIFLVPHPVPFGLAIALFVMGIARAVGLIRQLIINDHGIRDRQKRRIFRKTVLSALTALGLIFVAVQILRGEMNSIVILVLVVAALLTTASWNAWLILVEPNLKEG
jgi:hypothetical protein